MKRRFLHRSLGPLACAALAAACTDVVQNGYPPLVTGCHTSADCSFAGPGFVCADGGCTEATCQCDGDCPKGLGCYLAVTVVGECVATFPLSPCSSQDGGVVDGGNVDGGNTDGGSADAGSPDGGRSDGGSADAGPPDGGTPDAGTPDSGTPDAGTPPGCDAPSLVFDVICAECHDPTKNSGSLDLIDAGVASRLVGVTPANCAETDAGVPLFYVVAGHPSDSYLYDKVSSATPTCGVRMPKGEGPLDAGMLACIASWIANLDAGN